MLFNHRSKIEEVSKNLDFLQEIGECKPLTINSAVDSHFGTPMTLIMERDGVLKDEGISLSCDYLDQRVKTAKIVAEYCAFHCQPYLNLIRGLQSAITYEWRRKVPDRQDREKKLIDTFENSVNEGFADIVIQAVNGLESSHAPNHQEIILESSGLFN
jgi:anaerobic magnesium-protoporphyrin IX monomethyl ester cyclase